MPKKTFKRKRIFLNSLSALYAKVECDWFAQKSNENQRTWKDKDKKLLDHKLRCVCGVDRVFTDFFPNMFCRWVLFFSWKSRERERDIVGLDWILCGWIEMYSLWLELTWLNDRRPSDIGFHVANVAAALNLYILIFFRVCLFRSCCCCWCCCCWFCSFFWLMLIFEYL